MQAGKLVNMDLTQRVWCIISSREWNLEQLDIEKEEVTSDTLATVSLQQLVLLANYEDAVNPDWDIETLMTLLLDSVVDPANDFDDTNNDISSMATLIFSTLTEDPADLWFALGLTASELDSYWYLSGLAPHMGWGRITDSTRQQNLATGLLITAEAFKDWMLYFATYATLMGIASYVDAEGDRRVDKPVNYKPFDDFYKALFSIANPNTDILGLNSAILNDADVLGKRIPIFKPWKPLIAALVGRVTGIMTGISQSTTQSFTHVIETFLAWAPKELTTTWRPILDATTVTAYQNWLEIITGIESLADNVKGKFRDSSLLVKFTEQIEWVDLKDLANENAVYGSWFL